MKNPTYNPPEKKTVEEGLRLSTRFATIRAPELIPVETRLIAPREQIVLEDDLVELMRTSPEEVPPIVVAPWGNIHVVVDGHHRLAGAIEAGHEAIWAISGDLVRLKHLTWTEWY